MGGMNMNHSKVGSSISKSRVGKDRTVMVGGASRTTLTSSSRRSQIALDSKAENRLGAKGHGIQVRAPKICIKVKAKCLQWSLLKIDSI